MGGPKGLERFNDLFRLVLSHETGVYVEKMYTIRIQSSEEHAAYHRRINSPGNEEEDVRVPHLPADTIRGILDVAVHRPLPHRPADLNSKVFQYLRPVLAVGDFGMKLQ